MATTSPSEDPQVPGNYPGTVQNPTQEPAPVSPASDPEVPALPNDVDPNFIPNPAPVDNTIDPEVPQPEENLTTKKKFYADPVVPVTNPEVPQPTNEQNLFVDAPATVSSTDNPEVAQPVAVQNYFTDEPAPVVQNYFTDEPAPIVQNYFTDAEPVITAQDYGVNPAPVIVQNYFTDAEPVLIQNYFTDNVPTPIVQNYFTDPVLPTINLQVPQTPTNIFSSLFSAITSLFSSTPRVVSPVSNPQVAQAFPVPAPTTFTPTPIPPVTNPQVERPTTVQNYFTNATPVTPATNPQVPEPTIVQNYFTDEPAPVVQNYFTDEPAPIVQNYFTDEPAPVVQNYFTDAAPAPIVQNYFTDAVPVSPAANPEVPQATVEFGGGKRLDPEVVNSPTEPAVQAQSATRIEGPVNQAVLQQSNPVAANNYNKDFLDAKNEIVTSQIRELEATQGSPATERQIAGIEVYADAPARFIVNTKYKDQIEAANAAQSVPANTPPPTIVPADVNVPALPNDVDPNFITNPGPVNNSIDPEVPSTANTRVTNVNQTEFAQKDPTVAQQYTTFKNETAAQLTAQRIAEREAVEGGPISVSEQAQIAARSEIDATADANFRYQDQIEAAGAGTVIPANVTTPTPAPVAVTNNPQVTVPPTKITSVSTETLLQNDPDTAQEYTAFKTETAQELTTQRIAEREAVEGGPISVSEQVQIAARAEIDATADANFKYQDQIQAAGAATVVPADTPPPTVTATDVSPVADSQVPAATGKVTDFSYSTLLLEDPATAKALITDQRAIQQELANQQVAEYRAVTGTAPGTPLPDEEVARITVESDLAAKAQVQAQYKDEIVAAGAGTLVPTDTPPPTVIPEAQDFGTDPQIPPVQDFGQEPPLPAPAPPSPSPYEIFLAQEAAATDAAQAEATARFNSQFDVVTEDPQAFPVDDGAAIPGTELDPVANDNSGYSDFFGADTADIGEFQAEPIAIDPGVDPEAGDPLGDFIGELESSPADGDGESSGFGSFLDGAGDFASGLFGSVKRSAGAVSGGSDPFAGILDGILGGEQTRVNPKTVISPQQAAANKEKAAREQARQQNIINQQRKQANDGDWRVRLRLAASANYLYNAPNPGILAPLSQSSGTGGVIFPYTPQITTAYQAKYNAYELTHSNYKGYFYQGSSVGDITINATFTAQDTKEANYLLAVIHFFRSVTKMFYGQDDSALRGAPPPLVFLQGLGEYQFNLHPCVVSNFNYTLPNDVDYIRALSPNNDGTNLTNRRSLQSGVTPFVNPSISRLQNAGLPQGGITTPTAPPTLGTNSPTYVPTKMDIQLTLLAIQTRSQVSNQFSLKNFANGDLIKGGFW